MMSPNPVKRPDVYELLSYQKLKDLQLKRRPKWWHLKKVVIVHILNLKFPKKFISNSFYSNNL